MPQLTLELPDTLMDRLARWAERRQTSVEEAAVDRLRSLPEPEAETLEERYERFYSNPELFVQVSEEEKKRYAAVSEERLEEIGRKLSAAGPLSEIIIEERGER